MIRLNNPETIDKSAIQKEVLSGQVVTVQFSDAQYYGGDVLATINELCEGLNENLCVRFYGHYEDGFDCAHLKNLPFVKNLELNCLSAVENFDTLRQLEHLKRLNVGVFELDEIEFLSWPNLRNISDLCLSESRKNNIDLKFLSAFDKLTTLFLNGHVKNIEAVGKLSKITELSLSVTSKASIAFLNQLPRLRKLRLILGGRENLDEVENYKIEELEIVRVKGFNGFKNLRKFINLRRLLIEDQIQIKSLDFANKLKELEEVRLINCKGLESVTGLSHLQKLDSVRIYKTNINFEEFMKQGLPDSLRIFAFYTTKKSLDASIKHRLTALGYADGLPH
ncbi:hypothetical protein GJ700_00765 [Duganella sp. FT92W]|uniref:Leucine-rich repeat domain-containing protein n=1 Tax=Pseudoduganella rivuli TaxID=2666085 RepID=A0A7X2IIN0_9BURK|nr:hypothetical protein [Pseudoduganella rivuli]MRV70252.1 hypothetical protein [Pseudoduganella rivuli]